MDESSDLHQVSARLRGFIRRRVRDAHLADDLVQDVLLKAQQSPSAPSQNRARMAWLFRTARNAIVDHYRSPAARGSVAIHEIDEPAIQSPTGTPAAQELARCVSRMVRCLPEPYRTALWLADHDGLTQAQIAARAGVSLSGAKSRVQRARDRMRRMIDDCCAVEFDRRGGVTAYDGCGENHCRSKMCASNSCADPSTEATAAMGVAE